MDDKIEELVNNLEYSALEIDDDFENLKEDLKELHLGDIKNGEEKKLPDHP